MSVRLNKLLATRGVAARRKCDELIAGGHVTVNGQVILAPGSRVDPDRDHVKVDGKRIPGAPRHKYFVLNKPVGVISTMSDPEGRRSLKNVLPPGGSRLFPVGRLDADTSGLLLLTNDGDLAHKLMHPRYGVEKFYRVIVKRAPMPYQVQKLQRGVTFDKGVRSSPARVRVRTAVSRGSVVEIVLSEGRYRQVRRMCEAVGLEVVALHRWGYGPVRLGELARGMWRELSESEVASLRAAASRPKATSELGPRGPRQRRGAPRSARPPHSAAEERSRTSPRSPRGERRRPDERSGSRSGGRTDVRSSHSRTRSGPRSETRTNRSGPRSGPRSETRTNRSGPRSGPRTETRSNRFGPRSGPRTETRSNRSGPRRGSRTETRSNRSRTRDGARTESPRGRSRSSDPRAKGRTSRGVSRRKGPGARSPGRSGSDGRGGRRPRPKSRSRH